VTVLIVILTLALLCAAIAVVSGPLRAERAERGAGTESAWAERAELESAREAKYREIRDAELDYRTGKLSDADYAAIDGQLRAEALEILDRLEQLGEPADGTGRE